MSQRSLTLACLLAAATTAAARPALVYEPFDYSPAPFPLPGCNGPFGWGGPWTAGPFMSVGSSLTHVNALPSVGRRCRGQGPMEGFRSLAASLAPSAANDLWASVLLRTPAGGTVTYLSLEDAGTHIGLQRVPLAPIQIQANGPMGAGGAAGNWGDTDLLVVRLRLIGAGTQVSLYQNPASATTPPIVVLPIVPGVLSVSRVYVRIDSPQDIDEIRIGDSFNSVAAGAGCYPDCNRDGVLNVSDYICFQTILATGSGQADCNGDGALNISDSICFQTRFALGCQ